MKRLQRYSLFFIFVLSSFFVQAQDLHLSQFASSPVVLNPGYTGGIGNYDFRGVTQFRSQWGSLASNFVTSSFAFDMPWKERWGFGGYILNNDAAKIYNEFNFVVGAAYNVIDPSNEKHHLGMGLQLGFIHKSTTPGELIFDNQYNNEGNFDGYLPTGEDIGGQSRTLPELNYGIFYDHIDYHHEIQPHAGIALYHITQPQQGFTSKENDRLPIRWAMNLGTRILLDGIDFDVRGLGQYQRKAWEVNFGFDSRIDLDEDDIRAIAGVYYRWKDAIIPQLGIKYFNIDFIMSYDINVSDLSEFSGRRGGIEFALVYNGFAGSGIGSVGIPRHH